MLKQRRRRSKRIWYVMLGVFVTVFLFSFLTQRFKENSEVDAASTAGFDPGYIISDYQMSNYNSMSEADIQRFLTSKNSCPNTNYNYYQSLSASGKYTWHWANGHFVCLSEERFGDGEVIGSGDTAAHIIWQAAQDYRINPQVLIVLLQKETSLITDPIPNNGDYRKATGYGCPDTAPCSAQYYGFKNQIRKAASLFRTVLDGGWTNYPLGNNYVQYNPNAACGGSVVNIRSLATSALYRYTPYQPNAGALAAGYGTAYCGAYGNRNFYLYFEDWFGGIKRNISYTNVDIARYMIVSDNTNYIEANSGRKLDAVSRGTTLKFSSKVNINGEWCIRTEEDTNNKSDKCILRSKLMNLKYVTVDRFRYMTINDNTQFINAQSLTVVKNARKGQIFKFTSKIINSEGEWCIRTEEDTKSDTNACIPRKYLGDAANYVSSNKPRFMMVGDNTDYIVPHTMEQISGVEKGQTFKFSTKIVDSEGEWCLRTEEDTKIDANACIPRKYLVDIEKYIDSVVPRFMVIARDTNFIMPQTMEQIRSVKKGQTFKFSTKIVDSEGEWCIRTESDTKSNANACIPRKYLVEIDN